MFRKFVNGVLAMTLVAVASPANSSADVIITEIFYNLFGSEGGETEWIEIANTGDSAVDLEGWSYGDSQDGVFASGFGPGTILNAKEAAVIVFQDSATFNSIWGGGIKVFQMDTPISLANNGSPTNETVAIRNALDAIVDEVNFDNGDPGEFFPVGQEGHTIYLKPGFFNPVSNDDGANWAISEVGVDGAFQAAIQNPDVNNVDPGEFDIASPGFVAGLTAVPEPSTTFILAAGTLACFIRRRQR